MPWGIFNRESKGQKAVRRIATMHEAQSKKAKAAHRPRKVSTIRVVDEKVKEDNAAAA